MVGAMPSCCHLGTWSVHTIQPCHFIQSHIQRERVCLAITCRLHYWQNNQNLLCATAVTSGWNGHWSIQSQHKKLTLEKKTLPLLLPGLEPATFWSWGWCSTTELSPLTTSQKNGSTSMCEAVPNGYFSLICHIKRCLYSTKTANFFCQ